VIKDILDVSLVESGQLLLEKKATSVEQLLDSVLKMVIHHKLGEKKVVCNVSPDVPAFIEADYTRLKQILLNLITNAIKFSPDQSQVEVNVKSTKIDANNCSIEVSVTDHGIGIKPEQFSALFKPFSQVDQSFTRKFDGIGLGLSICKKIVDAMEGNIWLQSEAGKGSTFFFNFNARITKPEVVPLPVNNKVNSQTEANAGTEASGATKTLSILVVEDNLVNQKVICRMLDKLGHKVRAAINGTKGIEEVNSHLFDVIFMDLNMPDISGFDVTIKINAMDWSKTPKPSIIALTACAFKEDQLRCLQVGMEDFVAKPFTLGIIQNTLERIILSKEGGK